jgi:hypothetical protein
MCSNTKLSLLNTMAHAITKLHKLHRYCYQLLLIFFFAATFNHILSIYTHSSLLLLLYFMACVNWFVLSYFHLMYGLYFHTFLNPLAPSDPYMGRTAQLTSRRCILNTYSTNIRTEYFKRAALSPFLFIKMPFIS